MIPAARTLCATGALLATSAPLAAQPPRLTSAQPPAVVVAAPEPVLAPPRAMEPVVAGGERIALQAPMPFPAPAPLAPDPTGAVVLDGQLYVTEVRGAQSRPSVKPPSGKPTPAPGQSSSRPAHQGFSVVLVLADIAGTPASAGEDVPPAARRALTDMKDFLPYKSYKLLDAAWLLGQGTQTIRLRGLEGQEYELRLTTPTYANRGDPGRVSVHFSLRDAQDQDQAVATALMAQTLESRSEHAQRVEELQRLTRQLRQAQERQDSAGARDIEKKLSTLRASMARTDSALRRVSSSTRPIIDTNFSMDVGETVVVGTSRLKANTGALIALLTAVPPRVTSTPRETR